MSGGGHSPVSKAQKPASKGKKRAMSPASVTADRVVKSKSYSHKNHLGQTVSLKHHLGQTVLLNEAGDGLERGPVCVLRDPTHHAFQDSSVGSATMRESRSEKSVQDEEILRQAKRTHVVMLQQQEADADLAAQVHFQGSDDLEAQVPVEGSVAVEDQVVEEGSAAQGVRRSGRESTRNGMSWTRRGVGRG